MCSLVVESSKFLLLTIGLLLFSGDEEEEGEESVEMNKELSYLAPLLRLLTMLHLFVSFSILVAYYQLKVRQDGLPCCKFL